VVSICPEAPQKKDLVIYLQKVTAIESPTEYSSALTDMGLP